MIKFRQIVLLLLLAPALVFSQYIRNESGGEIDETRESQRFYQNMFGAKQKQLVTDLKPNFDLDKEALARKLREGVLLDGPVNPANYYVGPGDLLQVDVVGKFSSSIPLTVNPEGFIALSGSGLVSVKGLTLKEVKEKLAEILGEKFLDSEISVSLLAPRLFSVYVGGIVDNPGNYYAAAVHRVDQVLYMANLSVKDQIEINMLKKQKEQTIANPSIIEYFNFYTPESQKKKMSLRNIRVLRENGDTLHADLMLFYATGNKKYNPLLTEGDRVVVPVEFTENNTVSISGAVNLDGEYEYTPYDSLTTLVEIALGLAGDADTEHFDYFTFDAGAGDYKHLVVNYKAISEGTANDIALKPGDRIVVRKVRPEAEISSVTIRGEVMNPGKYPVVKGKTRISDVLEYCGGFTKNASLKETKVFRSEQSELDPAEYNPDYQRLMQMRLKDFDSRERRNFNLDAVLKRDFLSIDFEKLVNNNDNEQNILIEAGDIIMVPPTTNTVFVHGQVRKSGYIEYNKEFEFDNYIEIAGGYTDAAIEGEVMVIKSGTLEWIDPDDTEIEAGDIIYVPKDREYNFNWYFSWFSQIVSVVAGLATLYLLLKD